MAPNVELVVIACLLTVSSGIMVKEPSNFPDYEDHECRRMCTANTLPKTCEYHFSVEAYHTLTKACFDCPFNITDCFRSHCVPADGTERGIQVVNRMLLGPGIQVCKGDTVIVTVANKLKGESTTIHWHGIHQKTTQHMDGVPMVTQCPIQPSNSFTYQFKADPAGTMFYHSHTGLQRADGIVGAFVVRDPQDPNADLYDHDLPEHVIIIQDWLIELTLNRFTGHHNSDYDNKPKSGLINGMGAYKAHVNETTNEEYFTPRKVFQVEPNKRYRFRLISNAILNCPLKFSIDNHRLNVIASDAGTFQPREVDSLVVFAGERFDFVLNTTQPTLGNHWMRIYGLADCSVRKVRQEAILRYAGAPDADPPGGTTYEDADRQGEELNPLNSNLTPEKIPVLYLNNSYPDDENPDDHWNQEEPDFRHYLAFDFNKIDNPYFHDVWLYPITAVPRSHHLYMPQVNFISTAAPPVPPLSQYNDIPEELFCNMDTVTDRRCNETFCECVHRLKIPYGAVAELIVIEQGFTFNANHPFHLHGYSFRVVGMNRLNASGVTLEQVVQMDRDGLLPRKLSRAIEKDTVTVPDGGYSILRFHATNPGFWFLHCHINFHSEIGMGLIVQVGEYSDMPKTPKGFPTCGDWHFQGYEEEDTGEKEEKECPTSVSSTVPRHVVIFAITSLSLAFSLYKF